jgi:hypothetical protein
MKRAAVGGNVLSGRGRVVRAALVAVTAALLFAPPAAAFRTGEDSPALAGRGRVAWPPGDVVFRVSTDGAPPHFSEAELAEEIERAMEAWRAPECGVAAPRFDRAQSETAEVGDGTNTIAWVSEWEARGLDASVPGYTDIAYRGDETGWRIAEADILLNAEHFDWEELSLQAVLTHELGHALGLDHPCEEGGIGGVPACESADEATLASVMYPLYDVTRARLGSDDVAGICYLYPAGECDGGCGIREVCIDDACHATCGDEVCELGQACGYWGCGPRDGCLERDCSGLSCKKTDECGPLLRCAGGVCSAGDGPWGSSCQASSDCAEGACVARVCQPICREDDECGKNGSCQTADAGAGRGCVDSGAYRLGDRCSVGEDCQTGICLLTDERNACTLECGDGARCPSGWSCGTAEGRRVCVPEPADEGCSVARAGHVRERSPLRPHTGWLATLAVGLLLRARRRCGPGART